MKLFDSPFVEVSQGMFSGWKVRDKITGVNAVPDSLLKERIGLTWMQVRRPKKSQSIDSGMSDNVMFGSFAKAVLDPSGSDGRLWRENAPDWIADHFISLGNEYMQNAMR